ncbi:ABC transporter substrate-binding protein [Plantibacter sp. CFBP 8804]|uniref:ABC transporter substrate-binding protein n=1 Tax=Plantibacter sp. CFBP 8804 TaxID=2775270 RepID=UPI00177AE116|nr:extracellular solute-binding protein [Plantibacter sp. CFBP 8804]MBD8519056.1 extracellular solute-binding protein [Plantibacter sp. CFBP 8804]
MALRRGLVAAAATTVTLALAATGCSASPNDDSVTLQFWAITPDEEGQAEMDAAIADFEKENPGIKVEFTGKVTENMKESLRQVVGTPAAPDIFFQWSGLGLGGTYVEQGATLDLTEYYEKYEWDKRFTASALASVTQYGGYQGVPNTANVEAIVYNKAIFDAAGVTAVPTTYEELVEAAEKIDAAGYIPIEFGGAVNWYVMRLLDNLLETKCGAELNDELTSLEANWAKEPCVDDAFGALKLWADKYFNPDWVSATEVQGQQHFFDGQAAMALEGDWFAGALEEAGFEPKSDLGVFAFPTGTGRIYGLQTANYVSATSEHPDEAALFLDFLTDPERPTEGPAPAVPVTVEATEPDPEAGAGLFPAFADVALAATGQFQNNDQTLPLDVTTEYWRIQNGVATGSIPVEEAGNLMQTFIDNRVNG